METGSKAGHVAIKCARTTYAYESVCACMCAMQFGSLGRSGLSGTELIVVTVIHVALSGAARPTQRESSNQIRCKALPAGEKGNMHKEGKKIKDTIIH